MAENNQRMNIQDEVKIIAMPTALLAIITEYIRDNILLSELNRMKNNDYCNFECQGYNTDSYSTMCPGCREIVKKEKVLREVLLGQGKHLQRLEYEYRVL